MQISRLALLAIFPLTIGGACGQSISETVVTPPTLAVELDASPNIEAKHINLMEGGESTSEIPLDLLRPLASQPHASPTVAHAPTK